jgi:hypothetical protein
MHITLTTSHNSGTQKAIKKLFSCCTLQTHAIPVYQCGHIKVRVIILMPTCWCDKMWNFLFMTFCPQTSFTDWLFHLHHQGIEILATLLTIPSSIPWQWREQTADLIQSMPFFIVSFTYNSTDSKWEGRLYRLWSWMWVQGWCTESTNFHSVQAYTARRSKISLWKILAAHNFLAQHA